MLSVRDYINRHKQETERLLSQAAKGGSLTEAEAGVQLLKSYLNAHQNEATTADYDELTEHEERLAFLGSASTNDHAYTDLVLEVEGTKRVNAFIDTAIDSLSELKNQDSLLQSTNRKLKRGLRKLGMADGAVERITARFKEDYQLFCGGILIFILIFLYLKYF